MTTLVEALKGECEAWAKVLETGKALDEAWTAYTRAAADSTEAMTAWRLTTEATK